MKAVWGKRDSNAVLVRGTPNRRGQGHLWEAGVVVSKDEGGSSEFLSPSELLCSVVFPKVCIHYCKEF